MVITVTALTYCNRFTEQVLESCDFRNVSAGSVVHCIKIRRAAGLFLCYKKVAVPYQILRQKMCLFSAAYVLRESLRNKGVLHLNSPGHPDGF